MDISQPEIIKEELHQALGNVGSFEKCALLNYPNYGNIGDHLIWLGAILYLTDVVGCTINHVAVQNLSKGQIEPKLDKQSPLIFTGGGNLNDIYKHINFYEEIISEYGDRPIIILPQSIYFTEQERLNKVANIFNSHPNLTIFARENYSYNIALEYFHSCRVFLAPDMAFQLVNMPGLPNKNHRSNSILYHCRTGKELNKDSAPKTLNLPNVVTQDWASYEYQGTPSALSLKGLTTLIQQGRLKEWFSRQQWKLFHPYVVKFQQMDNPSWHLNSWKFMHDGVYQFKPHGLVITNRLHGHILGILLEIPHVFLANSYYKNQSFYETWTHEIPFCKFVQDASDVENAAREILKIYPI
ncbi:MULTISPECIES: polysaccharide pyruvyl transferase family protein [Limnospira]|uniref:Polysaccharide pyruvyl transferase n=3 Tax=Limnospira TaxID=2596745 RepID=B5W3D5_LIMMA|nr:MULTISPECIES: polysaccharide pyruvyl transferase family protein [Limnospira]MDC0838742.1 polysaccharide pyruvyl transferase family protein [Limnoraphis robusta]QJB26788.1 polysaccharide polymerase [Limnospira fusiformis SAG 85.79]EDZ93953.1 polysaccharide pyruvyl transferase [Limnospira maxima CS-328]MDT9197401.1 polysaccharide pyruvyl transferase family protein [Limnospira sp. PMC 1042.18]MDT9232896.1 polysaccharide pyruvyl transferase family protein [Limnospira sp. PMC 917.15]